LPKRYIEPVFIAGQRFVEIYQNCKIFNDGVFEYATDRSTKADSVIYLEHGKRWSSARIARGAVAFAGLEPAVVDLDDRRSQPDNTPPLRFTMNRPIVRRWPRFSPA